MVAACPPKPAPPRAAFLGVEHSLTGRRWAARLGDERTALAIAQRHGLPDAVCAAAGGARGRSRGRAGFPRADAAQVPARSAASQGHGRRRRAAGARGAHGRAHRRVRRLRRRRRHLVGAAAALLPQPSAAISASTSPTAARKATAPTRRRCSSSRKRAPPWSSRSIAASPPSSRWPRPGAPGST